MLQKFARITLTAILTAALLTAASAAYSQTWIPAKQATVKKQSYQCNGTTKKGERCKRHVTTSGGYCYQHAAK